MGISLNTQTLKETTKRIDAVLFVQVLPDVNAGVTVMITYKTNIKLHEKAREHREKLAFNSMITTDKSAEELMQFKSV